MKGSTGTRQRNARKHATGGATRRVVSSQRRDRRVPLCQPASDIRADALLVQLADAGLGNIVDYGDLLRDGPSVEMPLRHGRLEKALQPLRIQLPALDRKSGV